MGGFIPSEVDIIVDLFCIFPILLVGWMAFFAQFVLPVRTFRDRQKIYDRLITYLFGGHGPAIFIENGKIRERPGESEKKGPGVLWLDSASAAVTRTAVAIKQTVGPGVHFTQGGEFIAGTVDLHTQFHSLGPKEEDKPFDPKPKEDAEISEHNKYNEVQNRRKMVSALTRDGIEVIPNISVIFRVDTGFPKENEPGSRFGYRMGITKKARENEKKDKEAIYKAIIGQGVNLNALPDENRRRLAWNELPGALAVDVWREYVAKFTLDELFSPTQLVPPPPEKLPEPTEAEVESLSQPVMLRATSNTFLDGLAAIIHEINVVMDRAIGWLEEKKEEKPQKPSTLEVPAPESSNQKEAQKKTALQVVNEMVKARLTQPDVDVMDDTGKRGEGKVDSDEYKLLQKRGLKVISASVGTLRFSPEVEEQLIKQWSATWLNNAKAESEQLGRKQNILETSAQEEALINYAVAISREVNGMVKNGKPDVKTALKALLLRSRSMIRSGEHSDHLRRRMSTELEDIEDIIKWVEENGK